MSMMLRTTTRTSLLLQQQLLRHRASSVLIPTATRSYWQEVNRPKRNPQTGQVDYEQPSDMARRFYDDPNIDREFCFAWCLSSLFPSLLCVFCDELSRYNSNHSH